MFYRMESEVDDEAGLATEVHSTLATFEAARGPAPDIPTLRKLLFSLERISACLPLLTSSPTDDARRSNVASAIAALTAAEKILSDRDSHHHPPSASSAEDFARMETDCVPPSVPGGKDEGSEKFDSFAGGRRAALEATLVSDHDSLPSLGDIAGLRDAKEALLEALLDPLVYPEWFAQSNLQPWRSVLLYGPPGTGKSALCGAVARQVGARFYRLSSSDVISSWSGQSERLIRTLFDMAIENKQPSVIFLDEVDSLCRVRNNSEDDANRRVKTELLVQLPRLSQSLSSSAFLIAATNCPWELDPAFLRRFEKQIYIGLPDSEARSELIPRLLNRSSLAPDVSWAWLADETEGLSGDDLRRLAKEISLAQFRVYKEDKRLRGGSAVPIPLTRVLLTPLLAAATPTVPPDHLHRFEAFASRHS